MDLGSSANATKTSMPAPSLFLEKFRNRKIAIFWQNAWSTNVRKAVEQTSRGCPPVPEIEFARPDANTNRSDSTAKNNPSIRSERGVFNRIGHFGENPGCATPPKIKRKAPGVEPMSLLSRISDPPVCPISMHPHRKDLTKRPELPHDSNMVSWAMTAIFAIFLWTVALAATASADTIPAAGRLEDAQRGTTCSASLVAADIVLTAAHCVAKYRNAENEGSIPLVFRPGTGEYAEPYPIDRIVLHPLYDRVNDPRHWSLRFDLAAVHLARPVPPDVAEPLNAGPEARIGERLFIVSWRAQNARQPRQRACQVMPGARGLVTLACKVSGGESGAPVLRMGDNGLELVAVLSSRGQFLQQPVAQASNVALRLPPLLAAFK